MSHDLEMKLSGLDGALNIANEKLAELRERVQQVKGVVAGIMAAKNRLGHEIKKVVDEFKKAEDEGRMEQVDQWMTKGKVEGMRIALMMLQDMENANNKEGHVVEGRFEATVGMIKDIEDKKEREKQAEERRLNLAKEENKDFREDGAPRQLKEILGEGAGVVQPESEPPPPAPEMEPEPEKSEKKRGKKSKG